METVLVDETVTVVVADPTVGMITVGVGAVVVVISVLSTTKVVVVDGVGIERHEQAREMSDDATAFR